MIRRPPRSTLFPTRRSSDLAPRDALLAIDEGERPRHGACKLLLDQRKVRAGEDDRVDALAARLRQHRLDRKSTRLNSSHANISYAVFCLKKKTNIQISSSHT